MLVTKLVVRILGEQEELLGWAEVAGEARGDGKITVADKTFILIEQAGKAMYHSIHWCDVNVEIRSLVERQPVVVGDVLTIPGEWVAIVCGPAAGGLPPVTVRTPVEIGIPVGSLGAKGN
jgi:hypothetical protein